MADARNVVGFSVEATPGAPNSPQGEGIASAVGFSRESGTFVEPFVLEMNAAPGSVIHYTTSTNFPTLASPVYAGPIRITGTTVIRARVYAPGRLPGPPRTAHYVRLSTNAVNFTSDLPIATLHNFGGGPVPARGEQYVCLMIFEPKANGRSAITNAPDLVTAGRFRRRGSSTLDSPKGSWAFEAWDEFFDDKDVPLLGMPADSDWVMYAPNEFDLSLIHNPLAYQLSREIGRQAPRTRFVEVLLKDDHGAALGHGSSDGLYGRTGFQSSHIRKNLLRLERRFFQGRLVEPDVHGSRFLAGLDRSLSGASRRSIAHGTHYGVGRREVRRAS